MAGYDTVSDFALAAASVTDTIDITGVTPTVLADVSNANGTDSTIKTDAGKVVGFHSVTGGLITFQDTTAAAVAITSANNLAAVVQYLENNNLGAAGTSVVFTGTIGTTTHTWVFTQGDAVGTNASDVLVDLVGVTATSLITSGSVAGAVFIQ